MTIELFLVFIIFIIRVLVRVFFVLFGTQAAHAHRRSVVLSLDFRNILNKIFTKNNFIKNSSFLYSEYFFTWGQVSSHSIVCSNKHSWYSPEFESLPSASPGVLTQQFASWPADGSFDKHFEKVSRKYIKINRNWYFKLFVNFHVVAKDLF